MPQPSPHVRSWRVAQPVDATLYLMERWSVLWVEDFIEGLLRQRGRSYGIEARGVAEGDRTSFWQAVIVDLFPGGTARGHSSRPAAPLQAGRRLRNAR